MSCYIGLVKTYIHARLSREDREALEKLKAATGRSESDLVRLGIRRAAAELAARPSALDLAGDSAGRFAGGPKDLSVDRKHLDEFGA
jgi:predicted DNA-binding protein